mgnify:CR=1 FL=1
MRLIDADKLKREIQQAATEAWKMRLKANIETVLNQCLDWIEQQPTILCDPDWIPCHDAMPAEREWIGTKQFGTTISDEVYVTFESPSGERFVEHISFQNGKLSSHDQRTIDAFHPGSWPVAWKPLPKPYY